MNKILKNRMILISFSIILVFTLWCAGKYCYDEIKSDQKVKTLIESCYVDVNYDDHCEAIVTNHLVFTPIRDDVYTNFYNILTGTTLSALCAIGPLFIIIPSVWTISKELKSSIIKHYSLRNKYSNYLKHIFKSAYKCIWILPTIMVILFIIAGFYSKWNFDYSHAVEHHYATYELKYLEHFPMFFITFLINLVCFSIFYANLALIFVRKNKSVIITIIETYLAFICIEIINEVILTKYLFYEILNIPVKHLFNLYDIYSYNYVYGYWQFLCVGFGYALVSTIVVYLIYRKKEKLILNCELLK